MQNIAKSKFKKEKQQEIFCKYRIYMLNSGYSLTDKYKNKREFSLTASDLADDQATIEFAAANYL